MDSDQIRKDMRQKRRALSSETRLQYSQQLAKHLCQSKIYRNSKRIACYLAADGEMDLAPVINHAWSMDKQVYLPVLNAPYGQDLFFAPYTEDSQLGKNRYGIAEPVIAAKERVKAQQLDLVLVPLVAFDGEGNRIGMGAGYYDRTFSFLLQRKQWLKPHLVGAAFSLQQLDNIDSQSWDVPLQAVATEKELIQF